ncbi:MAG: Flp pilus assembly complex ATPase component TadA, partial [Gammaproteobacteria bacterium]|nr:Flp pilus assembly complex ATPase component TadA [Gammaproteobacteria bacterium]
MSEPASQAEMTATEEIIPYSYAKKHNVLVAQTTPQTATVSCIDTPKLIVLSELKRRLNCQLILEKVPQPDFEEQLRSAYDTAGSQANQLMDDLGDGGMDLERLAEEMPQITDLLEADDDAPIIRLINALLTQAIRENASDIHLEAFENESVVRFRVDGVLRDILSPRRELHGALVSRIKVMSKLDIAEKRLPQDGRM